MYISYRSIVSYKMMKTNSELINRISKTYDRTYKKLEVLKCTLTSYVIKEEM